MTLIHTTSNQIILRPATAANSQERVKNTPLRCISLIYSDLVRKICLFDLGGHSAGPDCRVYTSKYCCHGTNRKTY